MERCPRLSEQVLKRGQLPTEGCNKHHSRLHVSKTFKILILLQGKCSGRQQFGYGGKSNLHGRQWCFCNSCRTRSRTKSPDLQPPDADGDFTQGLGSWHERGLLIAWRVTVKLCKTHREIIWKKGINKNKKKSKCFGFDVICTMWKL